MFPYQKWKGIHPRIMKFKVWIISLVSSPGVIRSQRSHHTRLAVAILKSKRLCVATEVVFSTFVAEISNSNLGLVMVLHRHCCLDR